MTTLARAFAVSRASLAPRRRRARAMATREASYDALKRELATLNDLRSLEGLAGWDELVMMPSGDGAANARARAMATLAGVIHDKATSKALGALIEACDGTLRGKDGDGTPRGKDGANVRRAKESYAKATAIPSEMAKKRAELGSRGYQTWVKARESGEHGRSRRCWRNGWR